MLPTQTLFALALFVMLVFAVALGALAASGHFPREHRGRSLGSDVGAAILHGSILALIACLIVGIATAWRLIPWYAAIIGGGIAVLIAPLMLRQFSDGFVDGRAAPLSFAGAATVLAIALVWLAGS